MSIHYTCFVSKIINFCIKMAAGPKKMSIPYMRYDSKIINFCILASIAGSCMPLHDSAALLKVPSLVNPYGIERWAASTMSE